MDQEQKPGAGLLHLLQLLCLLPRCWAVPGGGKTRAPLCVRPEGSDRLGGERCFSLRASRGQRQTWGRGVLITDGKQPRYPTRSVCVLATFQMKKADEAGLGDLFKFTTWGNVRGVKA